jgi:ArsR family transcriptional regulator
LVSFGTVAPHIDIDLCDSISYIEGRQYEHSRKERVVEVPTIQTCCEPVLAEPLGGGDATELAAGFKVLADPVRLQLLSLIANAPSGEMCACDLVEPTGRTQPTVSHHLTILTEAGLLSREQRGKWAFFRVEPERVAILRDALG